MSTGNCSGPCIVCKAAGCCLADDEDDLFMKLEDGHVRQMAKTGFHPGWKRLLSDDEILQLEQYLLQDIQEPRESKV